MKIDADAAGGIWTHPALLPPAAAPFCCLCCSCCDCCCCYCCCCPLTAAVVCGTHGQPRDIVECRQNNWQAKQRETERESKASLAVRLSDRRTDRRSQNPLLQYKWHTGHPGNRRSCTAPATVASVASSSSSKLEMSLRRLTCKRTWQQHRQPPAERVSEARI